MPARAPGTKGPGCPGTAAAGTPWFGVAAAGWRSHHDVRRAEPTGNRAVGSLGRRSTGRGCPGSDAAEPRCIGARRARRNGRSGELGVPSSGRGRGRCAIGALAVGIRELEGRQAGVAPELLRIDPALLEGGVDPWLDDLVRQQVDDQGLEVGTGTDAFG